jgi:hypothetical protein
MKIKMLKKMWLSLAFTSVILASCEKNKDDSVIEVKSLKGMFVVCEGNYGSANGDITYYNSDSAQSITNLYYSVNNVLLGDIVQSFAIVDTLGIVAVNNSQKITVINMNNFKVVKTISGFSYPRSIVKADDNTVYVSNGTGYSDNYIYSINLTTLTKTDSIAISTGPETLIQVGSKVFATIGGGWVNNGNSVIEIDPATFSIVDTFEVASVPIDITADKNNNLWVYCKGVADYTNYPIVTYTNSGISKIEISTGKVTKYAFSTMSASGTYNIAASKDGSTIYFVNDGLYAMSITDTALPTSKLVNQSFYGVDVDPKSGNIICLDAVNSKAIAFNTNGAEQFEFNTAKYPNSVVFNY